MFGIHKVCIFGPLIPVACASSYAGHYSQKLALNKMPVKIRLQRRGRKKRPFYHIVIADSRAPRDGRFIEKIGIYNPLTKPATIELDRDKAFDWLNKGAQPTDTARAILRFKGVMYRKHLQGGVKKGALTQEKADELYQAWIDAKDAKVEERREQSAQEAEDRRVRIFGEAPVIEEAPAVEETEEATEEAAEAQAEDAAEAEAPAEEETKED